MNSKLGKIIEIPNVDQAPMPAIAESGVVFNGKSAKEFGKIDSGRGYPDVRSYQRKFGLLIPATNTSMEHELWSLLIKNQDKLAGIGIHTTNVITPKPKLETAEDLLEYRRQFLNGLTESINVALLAQPHYLILGMSLEHIIYGLDEIRAPMQDIEKITSLNWSVWQDAAPAALNKFAAKRIGLISPFDAEGNKNAVKMFEDLGFDVVAHFGFACAHALHIAHIPDWAKEKAIIEFLATPENKLDAIVQCGTNMSMLNITERLEPMLNIPILGINAVLLWHALRENGFHQSLIGGGKLMRDF